MAGQPRPAFYTAVAAVVIGLIAFAGFQARNVLFPKNAGNANKPDVIDPKELGGSEAEAPDAGGITTVKEYTFKPSERLPPVKGTAAYKPMEDNTCLLYTSDAADE